jgi:hypothetical protein
MKYIMSAMKSGPPGKVKTRSPDRNPRLGEVTMQTTVAETATLDNLLDDVFGISAQSAARQAWREAVATVSAKAKAHLPEANGRVEKAEQMVLSGDVELMADGKARVASQSNGQTTYHIANGTCDCPDFPRAPHGQCKHKIARGIFLRATAIVKAKVDTHTQALPEAPASANVRIMIDGREVQVTLRDTHEGQLMARMARLLATYPTPALQTAPEQHLCPKHHVPMKRNTNNKGQSWWSHRTAEGWCKGK